MTPRDLAAVLLAKANQDLAVVRVLASDPGIADEAVGFHVQQAIEKAIKAVLTAAGVRFGRTHALGQLLELLDEAGIERPDWAEDALAFDPYAVTWRYSDIESDEQLERSAATAIVEHAVAWATAHVEGR